MAPSLSPSPKFIISTSVSFVKSFSDSSLSLFLLLRPLWFHWFHLDNSGWFSHNPYLIISAKEIPFSVWGNRFRSLGHRHLVGAIILLSEVTSIFMMRAASVCVCLCTYLWSRSVTSHLPLNNSVDIALRSLGISLFIILGKGWLPSKN